MPRIRTIKPEFWKDHRLATSLSRDARLLYIGMWNFADDNGVIEGPADRVKAEILPYDKADVTKLLDALIAAHRVVQYQADGQTYYWLPKLREHQKIDRPRVSLLPLPSDEIRNNHLKSDEISPVGEGRVGEGRVREKIVASSSHDDSRHSNGPTEIPPEWQEVKAHLDTLHWLKRPELYDWAFWKRLDEAFEDFPDLSVNAELSKAEAWLMANPRKATTKKRWQQFVMNWFQIAAERRAKHEKGKTG